MRLHAPRRAVWSFRDLPLQAKGLTVVALPLAWLVVVAVAFYFVQRENESAQHWVRHSLEVRGEIRLVHTRVEEAETGALGYLLTREPSWLVPYQQAQQGLPAVLDRLESMAGDSPQQLARVRRIKTLVAEQMEDLKSLPERVPAGSGSSPALADSGKTLASLQQTLNETLAQEDSLLAAR